MKIWKNYDYEEERLYSTGSDELDELLERAFCEGYEYAQREFAYVSPTQAKNFFTKVGNPKGINSMMPNSFTKAFENVSPATGKHVFRNEVVNKYDPLAAKQKIKNRVGSLTPHYQGKKNAKNVGIF